MSYSTLNCSNDRHAPPRKASGKHGVGKQLTVPDRRLVAKSVHTSPAKCVQEGYGDNYEDVEVKYEPMEDEN